MLTLCKRGRCRGLWKKVKGSKEEMGRRVEAGKVRDNERKIDQSEDGDEDDDWKRRDSLTLTN